MNFTFYNLFILFVYVFSLCACSFFQWFFPSFFIQILDLHFVDTCVFHSFFWDHFHTVFFVFPPWLLRNISYSKTTRKLKHSCLKLESLGAIPVVSSSHFHILFLWGSSNNILPHLAPYFSIIFLPKLLYLFLMFTIPNYTTSPSYRLWFNLLNSTELAVQLTKFLLI